MAGSLMAESLIRDEIKKTNELMAQLLAQQEYTNRLLLHLAEVIKASAPKRETIPSAPWTQQ